MRRVLRPPNLLAFAALNAERQGSAPAAIFDFDEVELTCADEHAGMSKHARADDPTDIGDSGSPHVAGDVQLPQVSVPPHPSLIDPQFFPCAEQLLGTHVPSVMVSTGSLTSWREPKRHRSVARRRGTDGKGRHTVRLASHARCHVVFDPRPRRRDVTLAEATCVPSEEHCSS